LLCHVHRPHARVGCPRGVAIQFNVAAATVIGPAAWVAAHGASAGESDAGQVGLASKDTVCNGSDWQTGDGAGDGDRAAGTTNFRRVDATKEARLFAESALEAEQKKLETGKSTSFFVLQFQRDLTAARSAEAQALADYNKALAQLAFDEGTTLERNKLDLEMSK